eukprot:jgi/Galph1/1930/GphlegSOOS_G603.1
MADAELLQAVHEVLKKSLIHDGLTRGVREAVRTIEAGQCQLAILAEDCDQPGIGALVEALCTEQGVSLVKVPERKQLGEWAGLCKIDQEGKATKVVGCSCVVVRDFGEQSEGLNFLLEYLKESAVAATE